MANLHIFKQNHLINKLFRNQGPILIFFKLKDMNTNSFTVEFRFSILIFMNKEFVKKNHRKFCVQGETLEFKKIFNVNFSTPLTITAKLSYYLVH